MAAGLLIRCGLVALLLGAAYSLRVQNSELAVATQASLRAAEPWLLRVGTKLPLEAIDSSLGTRRLAGEYLLLVIATADCRWCDADVAVWNTVPADFRGHSVRTAVLLLGQAPSHDASDLVRRDSWRANQLMAADTSLLSALEIKHIELLPLLLLASLRDEGVVVGVWPGSFGRTTGASLAVKITEAIETYERRHVP